MSAVREKQMAKYVLYHNDADGLCAAWCAWLKFGEEATYLPVQYGEDLPLIIADMRGSDIYILDFCYSVDILTYVSQFCAKLVVLDHHLTAAPIIAEMIEYANQLADSSMFTLRCDLDLSGAMLAYLYFNDLEWKYVNTAPPIVAYVQDRDLWKFELPQSREVNALIGTLGTDWENWSKVNEGLLISFAEVVLRGNVILACIDKHARAQAANAERVEFREFPNDETSWFTVPVVNACMLISEINHVICEDFITPFSATFFVKADGTYVVSLRSRKGGGEDVEAIAKSYGGGGHIHAAGFSCDELPWVTK